MAITRQPIAGSSMISGIGYDPATQTLAVEFSNGKVYHHEGVNPETHQALLASESKGKHYNSFIRGKFTAAAQEEPTHG